MDWSSSTYVPVGQEGLVKGMDCSVGYKSAELKGGDQNLTPFLMSLSLPALIPFFL